MGRAIAREFAEEGCAVALFDINSQTGGEAEAELRDKGHWVLGRTLDITDYRAYAQAIGGVAEKWGHIDILVNNAAIVMYGSILEDSLDPCANRSRSIWKRSTWGQA